MCVVYYHFLEIYCCRTLVLCRIWKFWVKFNISKHFYKYLFYTCMVYIMCVTVSIELYVAHEIVNRKAKPLNTGPSDYISRFVVN